MAQRAVNPFPGVNPFVEWEGFWKDFHRRLINYVAELLIARLPGGYDARIEEDTLVIDPERGGGRRYPDVAVTWTPTDRGRTGATGLLEPSAELEPELSGSDPQRRVWIEVRSVDGDQLVTAIEVLSPSNKTSAGRAQFDQKHAELLEAGAHLVEIDLLIDGERPRFRKPLPPGDFFVFVSRQERRPLVQVYGWRKDEPIPMVPVPLRTPDADVVLDLAEAYRLSFERGGYPRRLRYPSPPERAPSDWREFADRTLASPGH